jgi:molybdate transport system ATP-binding protein
MTLTAEVQVRVDAFELRCSVRAERHATLAVLGANGAGKTTLLRAIAGLTPLTWGSIILDKTVLADVKSHVALAPERRGVGMVFADRRLFPHLTALQNVMFPLRASHASRVAARDTAFQWLQRMGVGRHAGSRVGSLSSGEAQRVALARACAASPAVLLLDEPFSGIDRAGRDEAHALLRQQLDSIAAVRILVTHDRADAVALATHAVVLDRGRVVDQYPL